MSSLLIGLIGAIVATNPPAAISNLVAETTGVTVRVPDPNDPVEKEFRQVQLEEQAARQEIDHWIKENNDFAAQGGGLPQTEMRRRILKRINLVRASYEDFIQRHPAHARARLAFADLLEDLGDEEAEVEQLEKSRELDPTDSGVWNSLANHYGHTGELTNAFAYYEKAIALDPEEPVYYHNFGTTVYLYRKDAREYFHIEEQQVFDKALTLYSNAMRFDPTNFPLATDVAQTFYGIRPLRTNDALIAWTNALKLAHDEVEREGVYIHMARIKLAAGYFKEARAHLNAVTNEMYTTLRLRVARNLAERENAALHPEAAATNAAPVRSASPELPTNAPPGR